MAHSPSFAWTAEPHYVLSQEEAAALLRSGKGDPIICRFRARVAAVDHAVPPESWPAGSASAAGRHLVQRARLLGCDCVVCEAEEARRRVPVGALALLGPPPPSGSGAL